MPLESESLPKFSSKFIEENKKIKHTKSKKGGPYSKEQRDIRQKEVHRLHFDYGYSARKISEMMKINRHTINSDIDYWRGRIWKNRDNIMNPEDVIIMNLHRLDIQRSRLREQLDKVESIQEKISIERMMYQIDDKILQTNLRLTESQMRLWELKTAVLNKNEEENHSKTRYLTLGEKMTLSYDARQKISKLIKKDKEKPRPPI